MWVCKKVIENSGCKRKGAKEAAAKKKKEEESAEEKAKRDSMSPEEKEAEYQKLRREAANSGRMWMPRHFNSLTCTDNAKAF